MKNHWFMLIMAALGPGAGWSCHSPVTIHPARKELIATGPVSSATKAGNLDSAITANVFNIFRHLTSQGNTIIVVSHDRDLARQSDRVIEMSDGQIVKLTMCEEERNIVLTDHPLDKTMRKKP